MPVIVQECPHCGAEKIGFTIEGRAIHPTKRDHMAVMASCNGCGEAIVVTIRFSTLTDARAFDEKVGDLRRMLGITVVSSYPKRLPVEAPAHVPENVGTLFRQAASNRRARSYDAASAMYRRALEVALKELAPDVDARSLAKRIDRLADERRITPELQDWAHAIRIDGNEIHSTELVTEEAVEQMHGLTFYLLTYLFTLPEQVRAARERTKREP